MKREINYFSYPGCLGVSLIISTEEGEEWQPMQIKQVARLWSPMVYTHGDWLKDASLLTKDERETIQREAKEHLRGWVRWSLNPNRDKNISAKWVRARTDEVMSRIQGDYQII